MTRQASAWLAALVCVMPFAAFAEPQYANPAVKACLDCHASPSVMGIAKTGHANRENPDTPAAQEACESCHGPSANHSMFPMQVENLHFGKKSTTEPKVQNEVCIECHLKRSGREERARKAVKAWRASAHGFEDVLCSTCHAIHDPTKISPAKEIVSSGCGMAGCHATLMGGAAPTSFTHAVGRAIGNKGQLTCTECHNPHGPLNSERCTDCHPQSKELLSKQSEKARRFHEVATQRGTECVRCHKALSHPIKPLQLDEQNQTMEDSGTPRTESGG